MLLIDNLLLLPFKSLVGVFKKVHEMAERELSDESYVQERLMELQIRFEFGEIGEEEYKEQERELMARLDTIRNAGNEDKKEV